MSRWVTELLRHYRAGRAIGTDDGFVGCIGPDDRAISQGWFIGEVITVCSAEHAAPRDYDLTGEDGQSLRATMFTRTHHNQQERRR